MINFLWRLWVMLAIGGVVVLYYSLDARIGGLEGVETNQVIYDTISYRLYGLEGIRWVHVLNKKYPVYTPVYMTDTDLDTLANEYMTGMFTADDAEGASESES